MDAPGWVKVVAASKIYKETVPDIFGRQGSLEEAGGWASQGKKSCVILKLNKHKVGATRCPGGSPELVARGQVSPQVSLKDSKTPGLLG